MRLRGERAMVHGARWARRREEAASFKRGRHPFFDSEDLRTLGELVGRQRAMIRA
jgi:hypothetical protein